MIDDVKGRTRLVYRDIPNITFAPEWSVAAIRQALNSHNLGLFDASGQFVDTLIADPRVTAVLNARLTGLFSREVKFRPANSSRAAKEVLDAWQQCWTYLASDGALQQIAAYQNLFGWWPSQICWDATTPLLRPILRPWHARFTFYHWDLRQYIALGQDGMKIIMAGDGKWLLHAPRGEYRAWLWGTLRSIAWAWRLRHDAQRDMAHYSEVYGAPTRVGITPAAASPTERDQFAQQISQLGANTTLLLSSGVDGAGQDYKYELVEAKSTAWQIFSGLKSDCDLDITLAILSQNLTTEVSTGSYAATQTHMEILQRGIEADNESWKITIHDQIARAFAYLNFGDADLAPWTDWDCQDRSHYDSNAKNYLAFGQALQIAAQGGVRFQKGQEALVRQFARSQFGIVLPDAIEVTEPQPKAGAGRPDEESSDAKGKEDGGGKPAPAKVPGKAKEGRSSRARSQGKPARASVRAAGRKRGTR